MNLKMIAAALAIGLSAQAHAIDTGAGGNGELFLNIWDVNGSYTRNLGVSINAFEAAVAATGNIDLSWSADANFATFMAGVADVSALKWNVLASDSQGAIRNLVTFNAPSTSTLVQNTVNRGTIVTAIKNLSNSYNGAVGAGTESAIFTSADAAYAGKVVFSDRLNNGLKQDSTGSMSSVLEFMRLDSAATGTGNATYTQYFDGANAVTLSFDANNTFHIAAVPEPEAYAMFLAGLGMVGAIARRRRNLV